MKTLEKNQPDLKNDCIFAGFFLLGEIIRYWILLQIILNCWMLYENPLPLLELGFFAFIVY